MDCVGLIILVSIVVLLGSRMLAWESRKAAICRLELYRFRLAQVQPHANCHARKVFGARRLCRLIWNCGLFAHGSWMNIAHCVRRKTARFGSSLNSACCRRFVHNVSSIERIVLVSRQMPSNLIALPIPGLHVRATRSDGIKRKTRTMNNEQ
jgi:hypothetical protein